MEVAKAIVRQTPCLPAPSPKDSWLVVTLLLIPSGPVRCGVQVCLFVPWLPSLIREVWSIARDKASRQHIAPPPCPLSTLLGLGWPLQLTTVTFLRSSLPLQCPPGSGSPPAGSADLRRAGWALMLLPLTNWLHGRALPVPVAAHLPPCFCSLLFPYLLSLLPTPLCAPLAFSKGNSSQNLAFIFRVGMASRASDLLGRVLSLEYFLSAYV